MNLLWWTQAWSSLRTQWSASPRLRMGALAIVGLLWIQALLVANDTAAAWQAAEQAQRDELARVQAASRDRSWPQRADDARQQVDAMRSMLWSETDRGLAEAALQDWVRATAAKAGLRVREVALVRGAAGAAASAPAGTQVVRARAVAEWDRVSLAGFLAEAAQHERRVIVDRLALRPTSQPPQAEIELRIVAAAPPPAR
jgi:hypothetical protein